jgi:hypothetical protein
MVGERSVGDIGLPLAVLIEFIEQGRLRVPGQPCVSVVGVMIRMFGGTVVFARALAFVGKMMTGCACPLCAWMVAVMLDRPVSISA